MSLIISLAFFAAVLLASGTSSADQSDWTRARLACADVVSTPTVRLSTNVFSISTIPYGTSRMFSNAD
jgi:hypothetical protein